jgi:hypothetical protein
MQEDCDSHLLLLAVEVGLLAVLGGGVELRPEVLQLLRAEIRTVKNYEAETQSAKISRISREKKQGNGFARK